KLLSSTQTLLSLLPVCRWCRAGYITRPSRHPPVEKKRVLTPMKRCACNLTLRRDILRLVTHTTTGIAITSALSPSLKSPSVTCLTKLTPIQRLPPFCDARANGLNQPQV